MPIVGLFYNQNLNKGGKKMNHSGLVGIAVIISVFTAAILAPAEAAQPSNATGNIATQSLDVSKVTTSWNLSFLYKDKDAAKAEYQKLNLAIEQINQTFRPRFSNLTGTVLLDYIQSDENFSKSLNVLYAYANAQNSLNVNDEFFQEFLSDVQNLSTEYTKATSFADVIAEIASKIGVGQAICRGAAIGEIPPLS